MKRTRKVADKKKGKTYDEIYGIEKSKIYRNKISNSLKGKKGFKHSEETKKKISEKMKNNLNWINSTDKSGKSKNGYYKGYFFNSSWELAYIVYCLEHNIKIIRNKQYFDYIDINGKQRKYVPDFILENNTYLEIKGYYTINVAQKLKYFPHNIIVYYEKDMKPFLDYVINKYGINFVNVLQDPKIHKKIKLTKNEFKLIQQEQKIKNYNTKYLDKILNSNIDFNQYGWISKLARNLNCSNTTIKKIMKTILPDIYQNSYRKHLKTIQETRKRIELF